MAEIRIIGTAHVSQKSVDEVREAIAGFQPDVVAVELDPARYAALKTGPADSPEIGEVLKRGDFTQLIVQWVLAYLQRRIGMDTGVSPGAEMLAAINEAEAQGIPVALIDRDIRITLMRFWRMMTLWEKLKIIYALVVSVIGIHGEEIDVDLFTDQDVVSAALMEFRKFSPHGAAALIDERDAYIAHQLIALKARHERVLAVAGAGHVQGISRLLAEPQALPPLSDLTAEVKSPPWRWILGGAATIFFGTLIAAIVFSGAGLDVLLAALLYWILINGLLSAGFTLLAGGHPLSAITAFSVSWMTSLNPLLAAGWFAAIVEAKIRKPGADDFRKIFEADSFEEMRKIPLFRVVLVAALANIGSTIGTFAYFIFIFPFLGIDPGVLIATGIGNLWNALQGVFM